MGMKALYVIEVKTRLIEIGKEIDLLREAVEQADAAHKALLTSRVEELQSRHQELETDHDLMRMFDESEWGGFGAQMDSNLRKLAYDVGAVQTMAERELVPA